MHRGGHNSSAGAMGPSPSEGAQARVAITVLDQEGVNAVCRSMMVSWTIKRAARPQRQRRRGGRRGGGVREQGGGDAVVSGFGVI